MRTTRGVSGLGGGLVLAAVLVAVTHDRPADARGGEPLPIDTTDADFFQHGTQPVMDGFEAIVTELQCRICHAGFDEANEPHATWAASMLGQSARDPVFWAALEVANGDASGAGQFCMRCHVPAGFLGGRMDPPDGSGLIDSDFEGITCNLCHRVVDPIYKEGISPPEDEGILADLASEIGEFHPDGLIPPQESNARYLVDPTDTRRGPLDDLPFNPHFSAEVIVSPHHRSSELCWTCHDVSNPLVLRQEDGTFVLDDLGAPHPTGEQEQMFPLHRTYSEWLNSYYNTAGGVQHFGRFGGNHPTGIMNVCQDCHLPDQEAFGCNIGGFPLRPDMPQHAFIGSNTWVIGAVRSLFEDDVTGLTETSVAAARARNVDMLEKASDLELTQVQSVLRTRVVNQGGHKLPTGYPDGRRVWVNVRYFDSVGALLEERGAYDFDTATLTEDTTIYECLLGLDADQAALTGLPEGQSFHFALTNVILKDNRIPPHGFSITVARESQSEPVGETYVNGQHWHDTDFSVPEGARQATVTVYYQLTARHFIEFLRDNGGDRGATAFALWEDPAIGNKSAPVVMDMATIDLKLPADVNGDGVVDVQDLLLVLAFWGDCPDPCPVDINNDGVVDTADLLLLLASWGAPSGACCLGDGSCTESTPAECADEGGVYQGDDVSCDDITCPTGPRGAAGFAGR